MRTGLLCIIFASTIIRLTTAPSLGSGPCPALPAPSGAVVTVDSEFGLWNAVNTAVPGITILIADGTYQLGPSGYYLWIDTPQVTLRSASGDRESVILDDNYAGGEMITIAASHVTIADLSLMRAGSHPIHVVSTNSGDTLNTLIYNVHIIDPGQQAIKINPHGAKVHFVDDGVVACSTIEMTGAGRAKVWEINGSCYTGGVDGHQSRGWVVRDNVIQGFWCEQGLSEHGVHFWTGSRDTVVERNSFIDNARGVGFGLGETGDSRSYTDNPCSEADGHVGHFDGIIRNNFIFASTADLFASQYGVDGGIAFAQACGGQAVHNTIAFTQTPFAAIEWRFANTDVDLINNLVTHNLMDRGGAVDLEGNLSAQPLSLFIDGDNGDLHLDSSAGMVLDQGVALSPGICDDDFDGQARPLGAARDIGADEDGAAGTENTAPVANDQSVVVAQDSIANGVVLTASDRDGDSLSFSVVTNPVHGSLSGVAPNLYYTPMAGYSGADQFTFGVDDGKGGGDAATVAITVLTVQPADNDGASGSGCFIAILGR